MRRGNWELIDRPVSFYDKMAHSNEMLCKSYCVQFRDFFWLAILKCIVIGRSDKLGFQYHVLVQPFLIM